MTRWIFGGLVVAIVLAFAAETEAQAPSAARIGVPAPVADAAVIPGEAAGDRARLAVVLDQPVPSDGDGARRQDDRRLALYSPEAQNLVARRRLSADGAPRLAVGADGSLWLGLARYGTLEVQPLTSSATPVRFDLPRRASRTSRGLVLESSPVQPVPGTGAASDGPSPPCFATEPETHGPRRLRVVLLCPGQEPVETWALLPGDETVTESHFGTLDGEPVLVALTREKLGIFVKQQLRVFALRGSQSRMGTDPLLAAKTDCPLWRGSELSFTDADGDGRDDLVLVCRKGLVSSEVRIEIYRRQGSGFDRRARTAEIGDVEATAWDYGTDWTGDGVPDLLLVDDGTLAVYEGSLRGRPVAARAVRTLALPGGPREDDGQREVRIEAGGGGDGGGETEVSETGGLRLVGAGDLDGDGRPEVVLVRSRDDGAVVLVVTP